MACGQAPSLAQAGTVSPAQPIKQEPITVREGWDSSAEENAKKRPHHGLTQRQKAYAAHLGRSAVTQCPRPYLGISSRQYRKQFLRYLDGIGFRALNNDRVAPPQPGERKAGVEPPQAYIEAMTDEIYESAYPAARPYLLDPFSLDKPRAGSTWENGEKVAAFGGFTYDDFDNLVSEAARFVWAEWDPEHIEDRRRWGAKGGRKSQRPPEFTPEMLEGLEGLSRAEQAAALGCALSTIDKIRRAAKKAAEERPPSH